MIADMFKDRVVVVTGGANGIGRCIADEFRGSGAIVYVIDKQEGDHFVGDISDKAVLEAFAAEACGFNWVKRNKKADSFFLGLGYWTRSNSEICLLGTRGHPSRVSRSISQVCDARIMEHSKKPEEIRERIVELCGNLPRIELFARERCEGWVSLGNEIDGKDIREAILEV